MVKINKICSLQGSSIENEDTVGYRHNYFWIIDGATDLYHSKEDIGYSVSEVIHILSESLSANCVDSQSLKQIFKNTLLEVKEKIGLSSYELTEYYRLPTFAFIFAKLSEKKLEYIMLGDCVMLVNDQEVTDHRVDCLFEKGKKEIKESIASNNGWNKKSILQEIRKLANRPNGYWIGALDERSLNHAISNQIEVTSEQIVLMSDGFFEFYSKNPNKSFEELIEMRKQSGAVDPIYGKKDDASMIVIDV